MITDLLPGQVPGQMTAEQANEAMAIAFVRNEAAPISMEEAFNLVENASIEDMQELTGSLLKFGGNDGLPAGEYVFFFTGMKNVTIDGKLIEGVELKDSHGTTFTNINAVLVNSCKRMTSIPAFIKVIFRGDKKTSDNKNTYKDLSVYTFG
jgi:hypothetical protein